MPDPEDLRSSAPGCKMTQALDDSCRGASFKKSACPTLPGVPASSRDDEPGPKPFSKRVPFILLIKNHWHSLALHVMLLIWTNMISYSSVAWLPAFYTAHGVAALTVQGMQMAANAANMVTLLFVGHLFDRMRSPRLPTMPVYATAVIVSKADTRADYRLGWLGSLGWLGWMRWMGWLG